jgi:uncharacterized protein YjiS (DUF1127 family)
MELSMFETLKSRITQWKTYKTTVAELSSLSSRELNDIGIGRADIRRLAREAVRS